MTHRLLAVRLARASSFLLLTAEQLGPLDPGAALDLQRHARALQRLSQRAHKNIRLDPLSPGQARVLNFVIRYIAQYGRPPTRRLIGRRLGYGATAAQCFVEALVRKGVLSIEPKVTRGIRVNEAPSR